MALPLTTRSAPQLLMALGVLTPDQLLANACRFEDRSSRNRNIIARLGDAGGVFIKSPLDAAGERRTFLAREFRCCSAARRIAALRQRLPRPIAFHEGLAAAVYALEARAEDASSAWTRGRLGDTSLAADLGAAIADCHVHLGRALRLANVTDLPRLTPSWFDPATAPGKTKASLSDGQRALGRRLAADESLVAKARAAKAAWRAQTIVHGDIKLSNLLVKTVGERRSVLIVDWESVAFGDPAWDLAGLVQSLISLWILGLHPGSLTPTQAIAAVEAPVMAALARYRRRASLDAQEMAALTRRAYLFAGVRMLQTAFEQARADDRLYAQTELHLALAAVLLQETEARVG